MAATGHSCFRLADLLDSSPLKPFGQMNRNLVRSIYGRFSIKIDHFFRGEESNKSSNQKQESPVAASFVTNRDGMSNLYRGPPIDASYQVSDHLAKLFQRKRFLEIDQSETRIACGGHICNWIKAKLALFIEDRP
jgi:hypothetical protein